MNAYEKAYGPNTTSMSDADYYGRSPALGVDMDACKRAAVRETAAGLNTIIHGETPRRGTIRIRLAAIRLSIAIGNQSVAEDYLGRQAYSPGMGRLGDYDAEAAKAEKAQLDAAAARKFAHPRLAAQLAELQEQLEAL